MNEFSSQKITSMLVLYQCIMINVKKFAQPTVTPCKLIFLKLEIKNNIYINEAMPRNVLFGLRLICFVWHFLYLILI